MAERQQEVIELNRNSNKTKRLVLLALFTAIVVVLQLLGSFIRFGVFSISLVLVPIVLGAAIYGPAAGAYLGGVFGLAVILSGDAGPFLAVNVFGTIVTVLLKGILAGFAAGCVYKLLSKRAPFFAIICAAIVCPVVNTGVFLIGCLLFFMPTISGCAEAAGFGANAGKYMIVGLVGVNFLVELAINLVLSSVISRLIKIEKLSGD